VVFVLNKMDEIADLTDEEDFNEAVKIKKENVINSLKRLINLQEEESREINVVGISANPGGRSLEFWFEKLDDYLKRSRISSLREKTNAIIQSSKSQLIELNNASSLKDLVLKQSESTKIAIE